MKVLIAFEAPRSVVCLHDTMVPSLRRYLGGRHPTNNQPLHLTVKSPFEISEQRCELVAKALETLAEHTPPFQARVRPARHFDCAFIHYPIDGAVLRNTIEQMLVLLEDLDIERSEFDGKSPHITLVNVEMVGRAFERAFELCRDIQRPRFTELEKLVMYEKRGEHWIPWWSMLLRGARVA